MPWNPSRNLAAPILVLGAALPAAAQEVHLQADRLTIEGEKLTAEGDVEARQGKRKAQANRAEYDRSSHWLNLFGDVTLSQPGLCVQAPRARLNTETKLGSALSPKLHIESSDSWVLAEEMERYAPEKIRLDSAKYTACTPPEDPPWGIRSSTTYINQESDFAHHWNARLEVGGWPVFYTPYFAHRTDDERHTGFLLPSLEFSGARGTDITQPFYWNIAPQLDATIGVRYMTRNGVMPQLEVRHLGPDIESRIYGEYLPEDRTTGEDRYLLEAEQRGRLPGRIGYRLDGRRVSDPEYLSFFGSGVERGSKRYLTSSLGLFRSFGPYRWRTTFTHHQDLQNFGSDTTLQELPRMSLQGEQLLGGPFEFGWDSEYVYFFRKEGTRHHRAYADPTLNLRLDSRFGSLVPQAGVHWTGYRSQPQASGTSSTFEDRTLPHFSLHARSQVQRIFDLGGSAMRHVVQPELFYLYVPHRDQSSLPVLDTRSPPLRFNDLFEMNPRFSGIDRIGDANQLTTALTNRLDVKSGERRWEAASFRVGQIRYFRDRRVTLPGGTRGTRGYSNLFGELTLRPLPDLTWQTVAEYDPDRPSFRVNQMDHFESELRVTPGDHRFRARYLLRNDFSGGGRRTTTEEVDTSLNLSLSKRWSLSGRYRHSFRFDETLLQRVGVNYDACCWSLGLALENRVLRRRSGARDETTLMLMFSFRTLGGTKVGTDPTGLF